MDRRAVKLGHAVCGTIVVVASQGCSQNKHYTSTRTSQVTWRAGLDDCREVKLSYDLIRDRHGPERPERRYEQLTLQVVPRESLRLMRALKKIELKTGVPRGKLKYRDIEIRTDQQHRKVWFVDTETRHIVATLDVETGATTGPDDKAPKWATPDSGVPLALSD